MDKKGNSTPGTTVTSYCAIFLQRNNYIELYGSLVVDGRSPIYVIPKGIPVTELVHSPGSRSLHVQKGHRGFPKLRFGLISFVPQNQNFVLHTSIWFL